MDPGRETVLELYGPQNSSCGYCGAKVKKNKKTSQSYGVGAATLSCEDYQGLSMFRRMCFDLVY